MANYLEAVSNGGALLSAGGTTVSASITPPAANGYIFAFATGIGGDLTGSTIAGSINGAFTKLTPSVQNGDAVQGHYFYVANTTNSAETVTVNWNGNATWRGLELLWMDDLAAAALIGAIGNTQTGVGTGTDAVTSTTVEPSSRLLGPASGP